MREVLIATAILLFGALPVVTGVSAPAWVSPIAVIAFAAPLLIALYRSHGSRGIAAFAAVGLFAIVIETIGLKTGFPYGSFTYSNAFGLSLPGGAPLFLPFAYVPLVFGALALAGTRRPFVRIGVATLLLVAVDLVLDPGAVAFGLWRYDAAGILGGVPLSNFAGWLLSGSIASTIAWLFVRESTPQHASSLLLHVAFWTGVVIVSGIALSAVVGIVLLFLIASTRPFSSQVHSDTGR